MNKFWIVWPALWLLLTPLQAQDAAMRVVHCTAISQQAEVTNIHIDEANNKWVGTTNGLYQVHSADNGSKVVYGETEWSLLQQPSGNHGLIIPADQLFTADTIEGKITINDQNQVSSAYFDNRKRELWIGTTNQGIYRFSTQGTPTMTAHFSTDNTKMRSNHINTIFIDPYDRTWVGTASGVFLGKGDKFKLHEKNANIQAITMAGQDVWLMGEELLWMADPKNRWIPGDVDLTLAEGEIKDICYDSDLRLWLASEVITRYDVVNDKVERFGRGEGFTSKKVTCIAIDKEDALWVGTADKGLFLIEKQSAMTVSCEVSRPLSCQGRGGDAALEVKIIGGLPPYKYEWDKGLRGANPEGLSAGLYTVTVTDSEDRKKVVSAMVADTDLAIEFQTLREPSGANFEDAMVKAKASGGRPDYTFSWAGGNQTATADGLGVGTHQLTVTDANGCTKVAEVTLEAPAEPTYDDLALEIKTEGQNLCPDDRNVSAVIETSGGLGPYQYAWNDPAFQGNRIGNLGSGKYIVTVTDTRNNRAEATVWIQAVPAMEAKVMLVEAAGDKNSRDGKAIARVQGGTEPYTYIWDNGEEEQQAVRLGIGMHQVTIVDASNCRVESSVDIRTKEVPALSLRNLSEGEIIRLEKLFFQADSSNIEPPSIPTLEEVRQFLDAHPTIAIEVGGHTNNIPEHEYCDRLSTARAKAVADYLTSRGINQNRVQYKGYGKRKPIASNNSSAGRRKNQRVEIKILSLTKEG